MRDTSTWSEGLRKQLRKSSELQVYVESLFPDENSIQQKELKRLARLIANVELGLTLLRNIVPSEPAIAVKALLSGYRFPLPCLQNEDNWRKVKMARFYLIRLKGELWERSLDEYIQLPEELRIFELEDVNDIPELGYTSIFPGRFNSLYRPTLEKTPPHTAKKIELASVGLWYAKISAKGNSHQEVPIYIPQAVADLDLSNTVTFTKTRQVTNPAYSVSRDTLLEEAGEMDRKLEEAGHKAENYHQRLLGVNFKLHDPTTNDYQDGQKISINKLVHIVGLLNVGKSTLLQILIYHLAKKGLRCALVVDNVASQVRLASLFRFGLDIPAAPVLGKDRAEHLKKVYEPILLTQGEDIYKGGTHPAWRWFSPICPLLALNQSETIWEFGNEPCHQLKQKSFEDQNNNSDDDEKEDDEHTCPFYYRCPRHQIEKDIATAKVWLLTPGSLIHSRVPLQVFSENMRFAEAVYRECNFLFVDEADRVQVQFDEDFAPDEVLLSNSENSFLNKLGLNLNPIYSSNRTIMTADLFESWNNAQHDAQKTIDRICPILYQQEKLVNWLGDSPFTARSLFARLIRELTNPEDTEETTKSKYKLTRSQKSRERKQKILKGLFSLQQKEQQKKLLKSLDAFLQAPLNPAEDKLAYIALSAIAGNNYDFVLEEIERWWHEWLKAHDITKPGDDAFEELKRKTYFAILIAVLENRLFFLINRLSIIARLIDLHELRQWLINRPPYDYFAIVPNSPVGNILGFRYTRDYTSNKGGKLEYFRYLGIGRYLLLNFPYLFDVDDIEGCHTVLISGTSYAPGSPAYHIKEIPKVLLTPALNNNKAGDAGIAESEFYFAPQQLNGKYIAISGLLPDRRKQADEEMVKAICYAPGRTKSFLERLFQELAEEAKEKPNILGDRSRLLVISNSYIETEIIDRSLKKFYRRLGINEIQGLIRDNNINGDGIPRGKLESIKNTPIKILSAPLMALERGHNILNDAKKAAFGAGIFINRPMPVPDDWQATVRQLNAWTLDNVENASFYSQEIAIRGSSLTLATASTVFYGLAVNKMIDLNCRAMSYKQLSSEERSVLCWTQLVSMWQVIGRLVRGGVPCRVYFLDVRFADNFTADKPETETTSLLVGIIKELEQTMQADKKYKRTLAKYLYGAFLNALKNTDQLDY